MKTKFLLFLVFISLHAFSQLPADLKFDKNFVESENHWVILPPKSPTEKEFYLGYVYFDNSGGGYSMQEINKFTYENGRFTKKEISKTADFIQRLAGNTVNFAFVPDEGLKQMQLEKYPAMMKVYGLEVENDDKKLNRASALNGMDRADLALPILQGLYQKKFENSKLYFELAYAYNALKNYKDAIRISDEAERKGYVDELMIKEKNFAYIHDNQLDKGSEYLEINLTKFKTPLYKEEAIANTVILFFNSKDYTKAKKWLDIYFKNFPSNGKYIRAMQQISSELQKSDSNSR